MIQSMSASYLFVLHFVFCWFFRICQLRFVFFASFVFHFVCVLTTDKTEQLTWALFRILYFIWVFVLLSMFFVFISHFVVSRFLMSAIPRAFSDSNLQASSFWWYSPSGKQQILGSSSRNTQIYSDSGRLHCLFSIADFSCLP
jgi:hypothetical protein